MAAGCTQAHITGAVGARGSRPHYGPSLPPCCLLCLHCFGAQTALQPFQLLQQKTGGESQQHSPRGVPALLLRPGKGEVITQVLLSPSSLPWGLLLFHLGLYRRLECISGCFDLQSQGSSSH